MSKRGKRKKGEKGGKGKIYKNKVIMKKNCVLVLILHNFRWQVDVIYRHF